MKRPIALLLALTLIFPLSSVYADDITLRPEVVVPELVGIPLSLEGAAEIKSSPKGVELAKLAQYTDISGNGFQNDIVRMTFEGIFKNYGNGKFNPKGTLSKQDALILMVRMMGQEAAVQQGVLTTSQGQSAEAVSRQMQQAYADQAVASGILTADENTSLDQPATREQIAVWTARAIALQPDFTDVDGIYTYKDVQSVKPENRGLLEALLREKIFTMDTGSLFNPGRRVTRDEMAGVLAEISPRTYEARNLAAVSGMIAGITSEAKSEAGGVITTRTITLQGIDGTVSKIMTTIDSKTGLRTDFGVYKNGKVTTSDGLALGDQVDIVTRDDLAIFAEVLNDGTILDRLKADNLQGENLRTYYGTIYDRIPEVRKEAGKTFNVDRIRVKNHTGQTFDIVIKTDAATGVRSDIFVTKNGISGGAALLQNGDFIEYTVKDPDILIFAAAKPAQVSEIKGTIRSVTTPETGPAIMTVQDYANVISVYPVAGYADISINTGYAKLTDLKYAMPVVLTLNNGLITRIGAETFSNPGYIDPANRMIFGTVKGISGDFVTVQTGDGSSAGYTVNGQSQLTKNNQPVPFATLKAGDRVKLYFPDIYTMTPSKVEIEGPEQLIQGVYTGKVAQVNGATGLVSLQAPSLLKNGQWLATGQYMRDFYITPAATIYAQGRKISINDLKNYYMNGEVYIALKDGYTRPEAIRVVVKNGGERQYASGVYKVDQAIGRFELDNRTNVAYDAGTIFLRDDRMVDMSNLSPQDSVSVVANFKTGNTQAAIVSLNGTQQLQLGGFYVGYVDAVYSSRVDLEYASMLTDNVMPSVETGATTSLYFGNASRITDVTDEDDPETLTPYTFFNGSYSKEENEDSDDEGLDYERYYALAYTDENGEIVDMIIRKNALFKNDDIDNTLERESELDDEMDDQLDLLVVTKGTVSGLDTDWNRLQMSNAMDWIDYQKEWNVNRSDMYVGVQDALIVRNNRPITFEDIQAGDRIQVVRMRGNAVLVVVEE